MGPFVRIDFNTKEELAEYLCEVYDELYDDRRFDCPGGSYQQPFIVSLNDECLAIFNRGCEGVPQEQKTSTKPSTATE